MSRQPASRVSKGSKDSQNRAAFARLEGFISEVSCDRCLLLKKPCLVDPFSKSKKCAECKDRKRGGCNAMSGMFLYFCNKAYREANFAKINRSS